MGRRAHDAAALSHDLRPRLSKRQRHNARSNRSTIHALKKLRIGVYETSALREALAKRGITKVDVHPVTYDGDLNVKDQPWWQVEQVATGDLDVAAVWGPFAGYVKAKKGAPLTIQPVNRMDDTIPLEFDLALGVRSTDAVLKYMLDNAMQKHRDEIKESS